MESCSESWGKTIVAKIRTAINQDLKVVKPTIPVDSMFLYHSLCSLEKEVLKVSSGTTVLGVNLNNLRDVLLPLAPLPEQRAIVAKVEQLFSELDNGIENLKTARAKLDIYRQAVLKKAFEGELTRDWRLSARKRAQASMSLADRKRSEVKELESLPKPEPGKFFVYIIKCENDSFYVGHTDALQRRWKEHCEGIGADWTKAHVPKYLMHWEVFETRDEAAKREKDLKTGFGRTWRKREIKAGRIQPLVHNPDLPTALPVHDTGMQTGDELLAQIKAERQKHYDTQLAEWKAAVKTWEAGQSVPGGQTDKPGKKPKKPGKRKELPPLKEEELARLSLLPTAWFYDYLCYAGEMGRGKSKHRPRNDKKLFGGKYPFIQTGDVKAQNVVTEYSQTYNEFGLAQSKLWPKGTLCITIAANIAETSFLGIDACFPDSIVGFTPFEGVFVAKYIEYFFRSAKARISAFAPATAQKNINLTTLENLVVPFCSLPEQHQIVQEIESRLSVCDKLSETIDTSLKQAESLRQSILKKAFTGQLLTPAERAVCRQQPDYRPAAELVGKRLLDKKIIDRKIIQDKAN